MTEKSPEQWPLGMRLEVYGVSARICKTAPSRVDTEPVSLLIWVRACELFQGTIVGLSYHGIDSDPERCMRLGLRNYPTVRLLVDDREIGRTDSAFILRSELAAWVCETLARDAGRGAA